MMPHNGGMTVDEDLAGRIREVIAAERGLTEQRMFGGLAFLLDGNMAVAASGQGGLMVRVDPADSPTLIDDRAVTAMVMNGRKLKGWLRVADSAIAADEDLAGWVRRGVAFARTLPAK